MRKLGRVHDTMACTGPQKKPNWTNVYQDISVQPTRGYAEKALMLCQA